MDRRDFFKTMLATPLLAPLLLASKASSNDELYLISGKPEIFLPALLQELEKLNIVSGRNYIFTDGHPQKRPLVQSLEKHGWTLVPRPSQTELKLSFRPLRHPTRPSFTLVHSGQIWDIRSSRLYPLWRELNSASALSSDLTIASLQTNVIGSTPGEKVCVYSNGRKIDELSIKKDRIKSYNTRKGTISVKIQEGKAWIPDSSCRQKICCLAPPVSFVSERIVCAPNHFLLEIDGSRSIDTIIG